MTNTKFFVQGDMVRNGVRKKKRTLDFEAFLVPALLLLDVTWASYNLTLFPYWVASDICLNFLGLLLE